MTGRAAIALAAALASASCAASIATLPAGPGAPAPDAASALAEAVATCQPIRTFSAELNIRGRVGGERLRARLLVGLVAPASAYLEAPAPLGSPVFILSAAGDEATLLLPRDRRVLERGRSADVFEALTGVALGPAELRATATGCVEPAGAGIGEQRGQPWRFIPGVAGKNDVYLHRERPGEPWRVATIVHRDSRRTWRADYSEFLSGMPRAIRLTSSDAPPLDLRIGLSDVEINVPLDPASFRIQVPPGTAPITIEELRQSGPLADPDGSL